MRAALVMICLVAGAARVANAEPVAELDADAEVEMALSAAPDHLRPGAGVYRLGARGFEAVRPSANGFHCLVAREPRSGLAPVCFDREGSETILQAELLRGSLLRQGRSHAEIDELLAIEYGAGRLVAPRRPGIAYMLSSHFSELHGDSGERRCIFPPHLMFYAPYLTNSDIGADRRHFGSVERPWILNEGQPNAYILVVPRGADTQACR